MSFSDFWYGIGDGCYWVFENVLEALGDLPWMGVLLLGFGAFALWMKMQMDYNKQAEGDSTQIK